MVTYYKLSEEPYLGELFLVMEDDNIPYKGTSWPIAAFPTKTLAEEFLKRHTEEYTRLFDLAVEQGKLAEAEIAALPDNPGGYSYEPESNIWQKYADAKEEWEIRHLFFVQEYVIPPNPISILL